MYHDNVKDPKSELESIIHHHSNWYGEIEASLVIAKQDGKNILCQGLFDFHHKDDPPIEEITYNYDNAILAKRKLNEKEFFDIVNSLPSEKITIKDFHDLDGLEGLNNSIYEIPSRFHFQDIIHDWPVKAFSIDGVHGTHIDIVNDYLIKPNNPAYPTFTDAVRSFLKLDRQYYINNPRGIQILLPDFRARIKQLEMSEKNISVIIECKESDYKQLILQIYARNKNQYFQPGDYELTSENLDIDFPFVPEMFAVYLINKIDGVMIDLVKYGDYDTDNHDGIIIKTPKEVIENLIANGENKSVEFKQEFGKDEFLETVVSFSNSGSGKILLGVDDRGNILGIHDEYSNLVKRIKGSITGKCEPQIVVRIEEVEVQGKPVVVVNVSEGKDKPYLVRSKSAYVRVDDKDLAMSRIELDKIYQDKSIDSNNSAFIQN